MKNPSQELAGATLPLEPTKNRQESFSMIPKKSAAFIKRVCQRIARAISTITSKVDSVIHNPTVLFKDFVDKALEDIHQKDQSHPDFVWYQLAERHIRNASAALYYISKNYSIEYTPFHLLKLIDNDLDVRPTEIKDFFEMRDRERAAFEYLTNAFPLLPDTHKTIIRNIARQSIRNALQFNQ